MDARVPTAPIVGAFGLPITVTRPVPDDDPVITTGVWMPPPLEEPAPVGTDFRRREPRKVLAVPRNAALDSIPRNTLILAPEVLGEVATTWKVDGLERVESDLTRVIVVPVPEP